MEKLVVKDYKRSFVNNIPVFLTFNPDKDKLFALVENVFNRKKDIYILSRDVEENTFFWVGVNKFSVVPELFGVSDVDQAITTLDEYLKKDIMDVYNIEFWLTDNDMAFIKKLQQFYGGLV